MRKIPIGAALILAGLAGEGALAAPCAHTCTTPQVNVVYFGATAPNQAVNQAMVDLYGDPVNTCTSIIKVYQCARDLDGNGTFETCVRAFVGDNKGSCEGVGAMDAKQSNFNVCNPAAAGAPNSGAAGLVAAGSLNDEAGHPLYANYSGSDVSYTLCEPVEPGGVINRPDVFANTEQNVFVNPFAFIVNRNIEGVLNARAKKQTAGTCPYGPASSDCFQLDVDITKDNGKSIFGNNNSCDWRYISKDVDPTVFRNVGTVMRNRLSGTRRTLNVDVLQDVAPGQGNIYTSGSGAMVTAVNTNQWCGTDAADCGENQSTGALGGGAVSAACVGTNANTISIGYLGLDRMTNIDNGTPADPHDDWAIRNNAADNYDVLKFDGVAFNRANQRCGKYEFWSTEKNYYDNDPNVAVNGRTGYYFPPGSVREKAVQEVINQLVTDAATDPTLVGLTDMFFARAADGSPEFPSKPYNAFCNEP